MKLVLAFVAGFVMAVVFLFVVFSIDTQTVTPGPGPNCETYTSWNNHLFQQDTIKEREAYCR